MPFVRFYPKNNSQITTNTMVQHLEESLSRILTHVYPATGRFHENKSSIIYQYQSVTLIKAKVNRRMYNEFLQQAHNNLDFVMEFWPCDIKNVNATNLFMTPIISNHVQKTHKTILTNTKLPPKLQIIFF
ncbi:hypothetical protein H5410_052906 [Solanum commersonii]|uniref:Uncharacterized protein n=1 Tax=Solanum commersonii TaxID=4109 RepID=A0A9J5X3H8_SOLCO|nr:hypothetical protein H5410_052906 [Solanum commersonii]